MLEEILNLLESTLIRPGIIYGGVSLVGYLNCVTHSLDSFPRSSLKQHLEIGMDEFKVQFRSKQFQRIAAGFVAFYYVYHICSTISNG